jgi:hypothetical protein
MFYALTAISIAVVCYLGWHLLSALRASRRRATAIHQALEEERVTPIVEYLEHYTGDSRQSELLKMLDQLWETGQKRLTAELLMAEGLTLTNLSLQRWMRTINIEAPEVADEVFTESFLSNDEIPFPKDYEFTDADTTHGGVSGETVGAAVSAGL